MGNASGRHRRTRGRDLEAARQGGARADTSGAGAARAGAGRNENGGRVTARVVDDVPLVGGCTRPATGPQAPKVTPTATIRSLLNLKKHMLKLIPDETRPGTYRLSFSIDTAKPCRVVIYVMAYEEESKDGGPPRIKCKKSRNAVSTMSFGKGLQQTFTHPVGEGISFSHFEETDLTSTKGPKYPVIIRAVTEVDHPVKDMKVETISAGKTDTAAKVDSGKTELEKVEPLQTDCEKTETVKADQPMEVRIQVPAEELRPEKRGLQAQTTYATLVKQGDGVYGISVIKQLIWVDGVSYVLHEIFGIDRALDEKSAFSEDHSKECVICLAENRDTLALPCRHLCMCSDCAKALRYQTNKCPICRSELHSLLVINLGDTPARPP